MYDHDFYAKMDELMVAVWKDCAVQMIGTLWATMRYLTLQPIRLYEYIDGCIQTIRENQREEEIRFQNLKQNGRI